MPKINTIVFDLDDTLIETGDLFRASLAVMYEAVKERMGVNTPSEEHVYALQNEIDMKLLGRSGVKPERFSQSLVETYRAILAEVSAEPNADDEEKLHQAGLDAFRKTPYMSTGSAEVLDRFADRELIMYTWGHPEIQQPRIDALNLAHRFREIHIVAVKDGDTLAGILGDRNYDEVVVCGDSLRNEIIPAALLGCHAVHLERPDGWAYLHADVDADVSYHRIKSIMELPDIITEIEN